MHRVINIEIYLGCNLKREIHIFILITINAEVTK